MKKQILILLCFVASVSCYAQPIEQKDGKMVKNAHVAVGFVTMPDGLKNFYIRKLTTCRLTGVIVNYNGVYKKVNISDLYTFQNRDTVFTLTVEVPTPCNGTTPSSITLTHVVGAYDISVHKKPKIKIKP